MNRRVAFVIPGEGEGSSMVFARRQAASLAVQDIEVEMFFLASRTSLRILAKEALRFGMLLQRFNPAVVHAHFGTVTAAFTAMVCGRRPLVITYRGSDLNPVPSRRGLRPALGHLLSQLAALRANQLVCVSRGLRS